MHSVLWLVLTVSAIRAQVSDAPAPALPAGEGAVAPAPLNPVPHAEAGVPTPADGAPVYDAPQIVSTPRGAACDCNGCCDKALPTCGCEATCAAPVSCVSRPRCVTKPTCSAPACSAPTCGFEPTCGCEPTCKKTRCLKCVCKPPVCNTCKPPCRSKCCVCKPKCHKPCLFGGQCGGGQCCNSSPCGGGQCAGGQCGGGNCDPCADGYGGQRLSFAAKIQQARTAHPPCGDVFGMMPQTCYNPTYGCYAGSRYTNRYPAFHGTYYRNAYNYRNYFDYPWHAEMHEPTSRFSYNTEPNTRNAAPLPAHVQHQNAYPQDPRAQYPNPQYQTRPVSAQGPVDPRLIRR